MAKSTSLSELDKRLSNQSFHISSKELENYHWKINPNSVGYLFYEPQKDKLLGRSKRVFRRLDDLDCEAEAKREEALRNKKS